MLQAKLYDGANFVQRRDAHNILNEYSNILQWQRLDGKGSLLDIGTGSGDVLMDFIYPKMPKNFKKIIGSDLSPGMVRHCKKTYSRVKNVDFKIFDMETKILPKEFVNEFDRITSFYCLHWAVDLSHVMKNIYDMLRTNGDCMLVFLADHSFFDAYKKLSFNPKFAPYTLDVESLIPLYQHSLDPEAEFEEILKDAGFDDYTIEVRDEICVYEGWDTMIKNLKAVNPFHERMPEDLCEEFINEVMKTIMCESVDNELLFITSYKLIVAYGRK